MLTFTIASSRSTSEPCIGPATAMPALFTSMAMDGSWRSRCSTRSRSGRAARSAARMSTERPVSARRRVGQRVQPGFIARHQDQVMAAARQSVRVNGANAGGSAGDERGVCIRHRGTPPVGGSPY